MSLARAFTSVLLCFCLCFPISAQLSTTPSPQASLRVGRDAQAVAFVSQSIAAMGNTFPADSTATGSVTITAGSETSQGTIRILTRSTNQTSIQFQTSMANWSVIYSNGEANRVD